MANAPVPALSSTHAVSAPEPIVPPAPPVADVLPDQDKDPTPGAMTTALEAKPDEATSQAEVSVPPAAQASPVELDDRFFDSQHFRARHLSLPPELHERDPRLAHRMSPEAAERRAHFAKYVKIAVGVASALCLVAAAKVVLLRHDPGTDARADEPTSAAIRPAIPPLPPPPVQAAEIKEPSVEQPAAAQPAQEAVPAPAAEPDPNAAANAKATAQRALDRGRLDEAVEAGEKSVSLDPADSRAWLILGAAYQEKGDQKNARRCYKSCVSEGKRGDKSECLAMLR
jgi:tetratricopeptide (TPR) repeat protein